MHVLPRVGELHERFSDSLEVIGVHSGKFITERKSDRIADACVRLGVHHPVVNDRQFRTWREYAVRAWPTVALIDPEGYLLGVQPGEFDVEVMAGVIRKTIDRAEGRGVLRRGPGVAASVQPHIEPGPLRFPTRAIVVGDHLWVADTGAGRVLECRWSAANASAEIVREHGGFVEPRGIVELAGAVFVADRRGQAIWRLSAGERQMVVGTGALSDFAVEPGDAHTPLRSPWGLTAAGDSLVIAMAGAHQLWKLDTRGNLSLLAGRGGENIADGPATRALLAQPTGVTAVDNRVGIADCETSAVRVLEEGQLRSLVGTDLFEFGDRPGIGDEARQQHGEDVAWHQGMLALADTYNDRLKRVDPKTRECLAWPGEAGEAGAFREPGGISSTGNELIVADTGNHRVVLVGEDGRLREVSFS